VRRIAEIGEFLKHPLEACHAGPGWVVWCASPDLCGSVHWGALSQAHAHALSELLDFIRHPSLAPQLDIIQDSSGIERVDNAATLQFAGYVGSRIAEWSQRIRKQVVVLPQGMTGMMLAGIGPSFNPPWPMRFTSTLEEALTLFDRPDAAAVMAEAHSLARELSHVPALVDRLRQALLGHLIDANVDAVAHELALTSRSLQRHLAEHGTSFSHELRRARVAAAVELLEGSELKVEVIAARVGFGNSSHMSVAFRRELGRTPGSVRAAKR
jgi:AraC-like DNA-binding protein